MSRDNFSGYILAGGKSSRMKTDKALLEIGGETFLKRAARTLSGVVENRVEIVLNKAHSQFTEKVPADISCIFDVFENRGALGGIHAALTYCETKYAVILAVDLPLVTAETIEKLAEIASASSNFNAVVPRQIDGRLQPLCAVYRAHYCLPFLEQVLAENAFASVNDFLKLIAPLVVNQDKLATDESPNIFFNVNRPDDFQSLSKPMR